MATNEYARFMWIWVKTKISTLRHVYFAVCYFPPTSSSFAIHNGADGDPFMDLYTGITQYSANREVILMGDFNARTRDLQVPLHDRSEDVLCTEGLNPVAVGLHRTSDDSLGPTTAYGKHL